MGVGEGLGWEEKGRGRGWEGVDGYLHVDAILLFLFLFLFFLIFARGRAVGVVACDGNGGDVTLAGRHGGVANYPLSASPFLVVGINLRIQGLIHALDVGSGLFTVTRKKILNSFEPWSARVGWYDDNFPGW